MPAPHHLPFPILLPLLLLTSLPTVHSHGYLTHPPPRQPGPSILSACGPPIYSAITRDLTSHIEGLPELSTLPGSGFTNSTLCNLWLCRGLQYADNVNFTQTWRVGEVVKVKVKITIPHDGMANVSVVDTRRNEVVGEMLKVWEAGYANEKEFFEGRMPRDVTEFEVTVPGGLEGRCKVGGDCVLQWWWYGKGARQTYESCVDFIIVADGDGVEGDGDAEGVVRLRRWIGGLVSWPWRREDETRPGRLLSSRLFRRHRR
ncbi:hypothetical protein GE09DRAFT_1032048 [Coniochaeta sp. 2T2.1]|nr:hypothetical protein GE09DRAFT_1032048 [Coniochaeta sp. 2T2.1]